MTKASLIFIGHLSVQPFLASVSDIDGENQVLPTRLAFPIRMWKWTQNPIPNLIAVSNPNEVWSNMWDLQHRPETREFGFLSHTDAKHHREVAKR